MFANFGPGHWAVLAVVVILLLGWKKLPDAARSVGKSMRIFKSEMRELQQESRPDNPPQPNPVQSERVDTAAPEQNHTDFRPL